MLCFESKSGPQPHLKVEKTAAVLTRLRTHYQECRKISMHKKSKSGDEPHEQLAFPFNALMHRCHGLRTRTVALPVVHKLIENSAGGGAASARRHRMADWVMIQQIPKSCTLQQPNCAGHRCLPRHDSSSNFAKGRM